MTSTNKLTADQSEHPKWVVVRKLVLTDSRWVSTVYEFFDDKLIADKHYKQYEQEGTAIVIRPYFGLHDNVFLSGLKGADVDSVQDCRHSGS